MCSERFTLVRKCGVWSHGMIVTWGYVRPRCDLKQPDHWDKSRSFQERHSSRYKGAKELGQLGVSICPIFSILNGEPRSYSAPNGQIYIYICIILGLFHARVHLFADSKQLTSNYPSVVEHGAVGHPPLIDDLLHEKTSFCRGFNIASCVWLLEGIAKTLKRPFFTRNTFLETSFYCQYPLVN